MPTSKPPLLIVDFDGVIVDSRYETFLVSKQLIYGDRLLPSSHETLWLQYRGLAVDGRGFLPLHQSIENFLLDPSDPSIPTLFAKNYSQTSAETLRQFEKAFFALRQNTMSDLPAWLDLHQLTQYGQFLQNQELPHHHILSTKNRPAIEALLSHFQISIPHLHSWQEITAVGSKGAVIKQLLDLYQTEAIYVDDSVEQLNTVKDSRVKCYFADWGYGKNTHYPVYEPILCTV